MKSFIRKDYPVLHLIISRLSARKRVYTRSISFPQTLESKHCYLSISVSGEGAIRILHNFGVHALQMAPSIIDNGPRISQIRRL